MKKILIITDAWEPQVNGVVTTMTSVVKKLEEKNFKVEVKWTNGSKELLNVSELNQTITIKQK